MPVGASTEDGEYEKACPDPARRRYGRGDWLNGETYHMRWGRANWSPVEVRYCAVHDIIELCEVLKLSLLQVKPYHQPYLAHTVYFLVVGCFSHLPAPVSCEQPFCDAPTGRVFILWVHGVLCVNKIITSARTRATNLYWIQPKVIIVV